jgi:pyruvate dehydrogenase E1 component beta subunit
MKLSYLNAIKETLRSEMKKDSNIFLIGEDIGIYGGAFGVTHGLIGEFGKERIRNTPISEQAITGISIGAAITGTKPIMEIMFMDFITLAMDQLINQASKVHYMYNGQYNVPLVIRTPMGGGKGYGPSHSQCLEAHFMHTPGIKIVAPYTVKDAVVLLKSAINDNNPVLFLEHKNLYSKREEVIDIENIGPEEIGKANILKQGNLVTIISYSYMLKLVEEVVEEMNVDAEIIDLRSLAPLDKETILKSVKKTGRVIIVEEGCKTLGVGAEIASIIGEEVLMYLNFPITRVASKDSPIPCCESLENWVIPQKQDIQEAIAKVLESLK